MALAFQTINPSSLKRATCSIITGLHGTLWSNARHNLEFPGTTDRTSPDVTPPGPQRCYSVGPLGTVHEGLSLPYPHQASLDPSVFEAPSAEMPSPPPSLPSLIHQKRFDEAARLRIMMANTGMPIEPSWEFERMAFRMLVPSLNPFNKARVESFHLWWSLVPENRQTSASSPASETRRNYLHRIITWLAQLDGSDCPTNALMRFGVVAASKGYGPEIADRIIRHVVLWSPPALSATFLAKFATAHVFYTGTSDQTQHWLLKAISTQLSSGRTPTASRLLVEAFHEANLPVPSNLTHLCKNASLTTHSDAWLPHHQVADDVPTSNYLLTRRTSATFANANHRGHRQCRAIVLKATSRLQSRNDPIGALLHLKSNFEIYNIIPKSLEEMLNTLLSQRNVHKGGASGLKWDTERHRWSTSTLPGPPGHRKWPSPSGAALLWRIAVSARKIISVDFDQLYRLFLEHTSQRLKSLRWQQLDKELDIKGLRAINSKAPTRPSRVNIYAPWWPPKYAPSVHEFNAFLWGCTGTKDLSGAGSILPSVALEKAEHIIKDMEAIGVQPNRYSLCQLAKACASAGRWRKLVATLDRMHQAGMLEQNRLPSVAKPRSHSSPRKSRVVGGTNQFLRSLALRLKRAGRQRRSQTLRRWAKWNRYRSIL